MNTNSSSSSSNAGGGKTNSNKPPSVTNPYAKKNKRKQPGNLAPSTKTTAHTFSYATTSTTSRTTATARSGGATSAAAAVAKTKHTQGAIAADGSFGMSALNFVPGSFSQAFAETIDATPNFRRVSDSFQQQQQQQQHTTTTTNPSRSKKGNTKTKQEGRDRQYQQQQSHRDGAAQSTSTTSTATNIATTKPPDTAQPDIRIHHTMLQPHVLYVSLKQKGNPVLELIRNVPLAYSPMVPDYIMSPTTCGLFLSLKYHKLYPQYIHRRLAELGKDFKLRILLVYVDVDDNTTALFHLNVLGVRQQWTVILCWSELECARYLETYKTKAGTTDITCITKKAPTNVLERVTDFLVAGHRGIGGVNKTDCTTLWSTFGTVSAMAQATADDFSVCPGLGPRKVQRLHAAFHQPFSTHQTRNRQRQRRRQQQQEQDDQEAKAKDEDEDEETRTGTTTGQEAGKTAVVTTKTTTNQDEKDIEEEILECK